MAGGPSYALDSKQLLAADFSMLPPLDRPKTLVDDEGKDLPSTDTPRPEHDSHPTHQNG